MTATDLSSIASLPFDELPEDMRALAYGVNYARISTPIGGQVYLTRYGWTLLDNVMPDRWFCHKEYARDGERLKGGTGAVFHLDTCSLTSGKREGLVIKFSRFAQDVPIFVEESFSAMLPRQLIDSARFNDPFEEFGMVMALRRNTAGPDHLRVRTKRPLAIYSPAREYDIWQLGRTQARFNHYERNIERDQRHSPFAPLTLDIRRDYILLYEWVDGYNAEEAFVRGELSEPELHAMTFRVTDELMTKGFRVLDNKPKHFILRHRRKTGELMRRKGELVYTLVDFELLQRI